MSENQSQVENQSQEVVETLPALKSWVVHCCTCDGDFQITVPTLKVLRYCPFCGDKMLHAFERGRAEGMTNYPNRIPNPDDCVRDVVDRICQKLGVPRRVFLGRDIEVDVEKAREAMASLLLPLHPSGFEFQGKRMDTPITHELWMALDRIILDEARHRLRMGKAAWEWNAEKQQWDLVLTKEGMIGVVFQHLVKCGLTKEHAWAFIEKATVEEMRTMFELIRRGLPILVTEAGWIKEVEPPPGPSPFAVPKELKEMDVTTVQWEERGLVKMTTEPGPGNATALPKSEWIGKRYCPKCMEEVPLNQANQCPQCRHQF